MSEANIRAAIYNILSGVTDIGKVYDYERWSTDWKQLINLFKTTISGVDQIRGWEIGRKSVGEKPFTLTLNLRDHGFVIRGYMRVNNALASEKTFNNLIEAVADAFRNNFTLNGAAESHDYIQAASIDFRVFGGVLCHYAELSLIAHEEKALISCPEILSNGGFEVAGLGGLDVFADWEEIIAGGSTINRDTLEKYSGSASCRMDIDSEDSIAIIKKIVNLTPGRRCRLSLQYKNSQPVKSSRLLLEDYPAGDHTLQADGSWIGSSIELENSLSWKNLVVAFYPIGDHTQYTLQLNRFNTKNSSVWFDDVSLKQTL